VSVVIVAISVYSYLTYVESKAEKQSTQLPPSEKTPLNVKP